MDSNIFLASVTRPDFQATVRSAVTIDSESAPPIPVEGSREVRLWGAPESAATHYEKLQADDLVLFLAGESYLGVGTIDRTFTDEEGWAAETLWDETAYTHLYTLEEFSPVTVPKRAVNRIFEYGDGYTPGELMRVADNRVDRRPVVIRRALERYSEKHQ